MLHSPKPSLCYVSRNHYADSAFETRNLLQEVVTAVKCPVLTGAHRLRSLYIGSAGVYITGLRHLFSEYEPILRRMYKSGHYSRAQAEVDHLVQSKKFH
jgi:hypothetical protein